MIRGLQITMRGPELSRRITERIAAHQETIDAFDVRLKLREGDQEFDIRAEDGFKTLGELRREREHYQDRVTQLTMLPDKLDDVAIYALSRADLRVAELISPGSTDASGSPHDPCVGNRQDPPIDGLKLTISGEELDRLLEQRMHDHQRRADRWTRELARTPEEQTDDHPLLPGQICENEAERHQWRVEVLGFIRDHLESGQVYRLGEADLAFGELLPAKPRWLEQEEYEERNAVGFQLERLTKSVGERVPAELAFLARQAEGDE